MYTYRHLKKAFNFNREDASLVKKAFNSEKVRTTIKNRFHEAIFLPKVFYNYTENKDHIETLACLMNRTLKSIINTDNLALQALGCRMMITVLKFARRSGSRELKSNEKGCEDLKNFIDYFLNRYLNLYQDVKIKYHESLGRRVPSGF